MPPPRVQTERSPHRRPPPKAQARAHQPPSSSASALPPPAALPGAVLSTNKPASDFYAPTLAPSPSAASLQARFGIATSASTDSMRSQRQSHSAASLKPVIPPPRYQLLKPSTKAMLRVELEAARTRVNQAMHVADGSRPANQNMEGYRRKAHLSNLNKDKKRLGREAGRRERQYDNLLTWQGELNDYRDRGRAVNVMSNQARKPSLAIWRGQDELAAHRLFRESSAPHLPPIPRSPSMVMEEESELPFVLV